MRILLSHPHAELAAVTSRQYAGQTARRPSPASATIRREDLGA